MATPSEKLAASLEVLKKLQEEGHIAIRSALLSRVHRERLVRGGFLQEVMKGWYIPARPDETTGESTAWFTSFWHFCAEYFSFRFKTDWSLSPEQSVLLHAGNRTVPRQLLMRSPGARNQVTTLIHGTSLLEVRAALPNNQDATVNADGLRLFSLAAGLVNCSENFYIQHPTDARAALAMFPDASDILNVLLEGGHSVIAGRLAGAFRNIGRIRIADDILAGMRSAGYAVRENDPFTEVTPIVFSPRERSPYVNRIRLMWESMRQPVLDVFPQSPGLPRDIEIYMKHVSDIYVQDAYNSLSIEGYRVSEELIERVRSGNWNPVENEGDRNHRDAMAARGYWQAYQAVQASLQRILKGENAGRIADNDHGTWYREMFSPSVGAGIIKASDLAGYRNMPVYIRRSLHTPPDPETVRDLMPAFFELLAEEKEAAVRVVLGHFIFVYIHPYMDGNGRIGRFLMNAMLASGGYPWAIVPLSRRDEYMNALEQAGVGQNIVPFASLLASLVRENKSA